MIPQEPHAAKTSAWRCLREALRHGACCCCSRDGSASSDKGVARE